MSADLELFTFQDAQLRVVVIDGEPWFVAPDVARALGYRDAWNLVRRLDEDEKGTHSLSTPGGDQNVTIINESGLYVAVLGSQIESARDFKRWITRVVLPQIRKTGSYSAQPALTPEQRFAQAVLDAKLIIAGKDEEIAQLTAKAEENAPKVNYVDKYVSSHDVLRLRVVAANNNVSEDWLRQLLLDRGWIYAEVERYYSRKRQEIVVRRRYSAYAHKQSYFKPVEVHDAPLFRGEVMHTLKVTPQGAEAIARLIAREVAA